MSGLFLTVLNMSLTASYVILFVILIRLALKKAPKIISYALWGVVAFRLVVPFSFESMFSLMPRNVNTVPIPHNIIYQQNPQINSGILYVDTMVNGSLPAPAVGASANPMQIYISVASDLWILGIILLLIYSLASVFLLKRQLKNARLMEHNIYEAANLKTPFVLGIISPKIYLPVGLSKEEWRYIHLHEQTHIQRNDHIIKIIAFLIVIMHWFNPLVWIAFMLMSMDMELSCDERVLKNTDSDIKKSYANSLLSLATGRHILNGSPLAFGEGNVKWRIKNVLNYKKPKFWVIIISILVVIVVGIGLLANPKTESQFSITDLRPMIMVNGELYLDTGKQIPVEIDESAIIGEVSSSVDQSEKPTEEGQTNFVSIGSKYAHFEDNIVVLINDEWVLFVKETVDYTEDHENSNYDKISAYLKEECINVFSPYYELLDFIISDYQEEVVNGNVEAVFHYKMIDKNYDRDRDTVEYIKEAKERGDKNYQQLYDEYLQPRENNFYFKAVIDENGRITLYSKNLAIYSDEWKKVEVSDYIIK